MSSGHRDPRQRLDQALVARGLAETRSRAREAILRGEVSVNGQPALRPAIEVTETTRIDRTADGPSYVSRAAAKLIAGLDHFGYDPTGRKALDIGASTGGFTEVLLGRGALSVHAVDVGHGQLHPKLRDDPRVISLEGVNARNLAESGLPSDFGALTADVSFISLRLALPPALALTSPGAFAVLLFKPQFEMGPAALGKGGIVRDPIAAEKGAEDFSAWLASYDGWRVDGVIPSPILGGDGNREFLVGARRD